jgi:hypothetical protein
MRSTDHLANKLFYLSKLLKDILLKVENVFLRESKTNSLIPNISTSILILSFSFKIL